MDSVNAELYREVEPNILRRVIMATAPNSPTDAGAGNRTVILAGRLVRPDLGVVEDNRYILVEDGVVKEVGEPGAAIRDAEIIDLSHMTVLPGMIDCHTHLTLPASFGDLIGELRRWPAQCALEAIPNLRAKLHSGFTVVREAGSYWALVDVAVRDAIAQGLVEGPRMQVPGAMVTMTGGAGALTGISHEVALPRSLTFGQANSPAQLRERIRDLVSNGADVIKIFASGAVMQHGCCAPTDTEFTLEELETAVHEAACLGRKVMAHAHAPQGIRNAVQAGVASIEHGTMLDEEGAAMMKQRGTYLVPTLAVWEGREERKQRPAEFVARAAIIENHHDEAFRCALAAGVNIALGSDSVVRPHDKGARELFQMVRLGMSEMGALQAATVNAARLMSLDDAGSIAPGMRADIIAVKGDPLSDIEAMDDVRFVMQDGIVRKNAAND
ncbi:metal-dependent hydrolase family protein [Sphingopyxis terrae]|uniref:metal-dependent hydrolase family protein n=1 Tax=Sphingopyxis terrae TaxID=33052 RepID=UPI002A11B312|nr:amidohydrolase family protein [Sphingopyxis terrae]MDX8356499.1 amidohydrolase family protein [Sphingopyxis terrae]